MPDYLKRTFQIGQHVNIRKSDDFITSTLQKLFSHSVLYDAFHVLTTINFNDQVRSLAIEIDDVWRYRNLSFEFRSVSLVRPDRSP